jgi:hypothetical protein
MGKLASKTNDPNDSSFDIAGIVQAFEGGKGSSDMGGAVGNLFRSSILPCNFLHG